MYAQTAPSPLAPLVDEQRQGSAGGQVLVGVAGIVLAVILVMGQVSLATSKGIGVHLHASVQHMAKGNEVMESVIERAAPSVQLEKVLAQQATTLAHTQAAMAATNRELASILDTKHRLIGIVDGMQRSSERLASDVGSLGRSTGTMSDRLGTLPAATKRTHGKLARISTDTAAINTELGAIGTKMESYGLPHAKGAPTG
jgi:hypothetical protein